MSDVLQSTFDVTVGNDVYTFRAPSIKYRFELGGRAADIRRRAYPDGIVNERVGLVDWQTVNFSRACAILELYLVKASVTWPYGTENPAEVDLSKPPVVNFEKFPAAREDLVEAVGLAFEQELTRFRNGGNLDGQ